MNVKWKMREYAYAFLENGKHVQGSYLFWIFRLKCCFKMRDEICTCNTANNYRSEAISAKFHGQEKLQEVINTSKV